jgi:carbohydrate diacid regulator
MAGWHLDTKWRRISWRAMRIIDTNQLMGCPWRIIGSGDRERIGNCTKARCWCWCLGAVVDIDDAVARHLHGVRQGINLPLRLEGKSSALSA